MQWTLLEYNSIVVSQNPQPRRVQLDDASWAKVDRFAQQSGVAPEEIIKAAVRAFESPSSPLNAGHKNGASLLERLQQSGLLGCLDDAPADLSSNPAHLEGFGRD